MNQRSLLFALVAILAVSVALSQILHLPAYATPLLAIAGGLVVVWLFTRRQQQAYLTVASEPNPELEQRVRSALTRVGHPNLQVVTLTDQGRSVIGLAREQGQVMVSPMLGAVMSDDELDALLLQELAAPQDLKRRVWLEILWLPGIFVAVMGVTALITGTLAYLGLALPLIVVWSVIASQTGWLTRRTLRLIWTAYASRGGKPEPLLSAMLKLHSEGYRALTPLQRNQVTGTLRAHLQVLARFAGISQHRLEELAEAVGAPEDLYRTRGLTLRQRLKANRFLLLMAGWLVLLVLSVLTALSLGR